MADMSHRERIQAALLGKPVDRVPVAFWRHWPGDDQEAQSLAAVTIDFQQQYELDFIKIPVSSALPVDGYGIRHAYMGSIHGDRSLEHSIHNVKDWDCIEPLNVHKGAYGWHLETLRRVIEGRNGDTPVIFTMFNPLAIAHYLAGDEILMAHLRRYPEHVERALGALTETCANFASLVIAEGADGIFLSVRAASYEVMSESEYRQFGRTNDLTVLKAAQKGWFNVLHLHGQYPMFSLLSDYPVHAINWHYRTAGPSLSDASQLCSHALMAGVDQYGVLDAGSPKTVTTQVHDAIKKMRRRRLIVTPGCTYPLSVPKANLMAMRQAVESFSASRPKKIVSSKL